MIIKDLPQLPPALWALAAGASLLTLLLVTGQQLLWLPISALLASLLLAWYWPLWVMKSLSLRARCLSPLREGEDAQWQVDLASRLPLWGLILQGPFAMEYTHFIPGRQARLLMSSRPLAPGLVDGSWTCSVHYPLNVWPRTVRLNPSTLTVLPGLEAIEHLPLGNWANERPLKILVCCDSTPEFALGEAVNQSHSAQIKVLANLCRALVARGCDLSLATGFGLLSVPANSGAFGPLDDALVQAHNQPASAADLLARYNLRPDAQLIVLPQLLTNAPTPDAFPGQILWQLLFDEERFLHPLSRGRHVHRRLSAYHYQWVIEPNQPLARLFYVQS